MTDVTEKPELPALEEGSIEAGLLELIYRQKEAVELAASRGRIALSAKERALADIETFSEQRMDAQARLEALTNAWDMAARDDDPPLSAYLEALEADKERLDDD